MLVSLRLKAVLIWMTFALALTLSAGCGDSSSDFGEAEPTPTPWLSDEREGVRLVDVSYEDIRLRGRIVNRGAHSFDRVWIWVHIDVLGRPEPLIQPIQVLPYGDASELHPGESIPFVFVLDMPASYSVDVDDLTLEVLTISEAGDYKGVISRQDWDPDAPVALPGVSAYDSTTGGDYEWIVVHHSAYPYPRGPKEITRGHREDRGFADVGYHFIISERGEIYEGRNLRYMGAHAGRSVEATEGAAKARRRGDSEGIKTARRLDPDWGSVGIVVDGYFEDGSTPTHAQRRALAGLIETLQEDLSIPEGHIIGHGEVKKRITERRGATAVGGGTACPGLGLRWFLGEMLKKS